VRAGTLGDRDGRGPLRARLRVAARVLLNSGHGAIMKIAAEVGRLFE